MYSRKTVEKQTRTKDSMVCDFSSKEKEQAISKRFIMDQQATVNALLRTACYRHICVSSGMSNTKSMDDEHTHVCTCMHNTLTYIYVHYYMHICVYIIYICVCVCVCECIQHVCTYAYIFMSICAVDWPQSASLNLRKKSVVPVIGGQGVGDKKGDKQARTQGSTVSGWNSSKRAPVL